MNDKANGRQEQPSRQSIKLEDLLPRKNVKGGKAKPQVVFGALEARNRRRTTDI